ncbi:hypothetical protein ACFZC3_15595 [Streptomyces sp. NPDC007903]|uniref:hypothetical protein n=1 Tax=Streptomyces sp. NPDC007903 TaxID=3364786 RepID=UPI0036E459E4
MADEPTMGEVIRTMQALNARLDRFSAPEVYAFQHEQVLTEIREIQAERAAERQAREEKERREDEAKRDAEAKRQADRRLIFSVLIAPIVVLLLQLYLSARLAAGS